MTMWIVRHGRTEANASGLLLGHADPDLDDLGRLQADQIAAFLPRPHRVVSSPLARARQTASVFDVEVEIDDRFIEVDYGDFDLAPLSSVPAEVWQQWLSDVEYRPPNGESMAEMFERVRGGLDDLASSALDADLVIVSHVSPVKASLCWALGVGPMALSRSKVGQASITRIEITDRGPSLQNFNQTGHLG